VFVHQIIHLERDVHLQGHNKQQQVDTNSRGVKDGTVGGQGQGPVSAYVSRPRLRS
jgi:hypothetical protein